MQEEGLVKRKISGCPRRCDAGSESRIVYYDDDEGGVLQIRTMVEGEEILAARRLRQSFGTKPTASMTSGSPTTETQHRHTAAKSGGLLAARVSSALAAREVR
jgi:hypothetical protein